MTANCERCQKVNAECTSLMQQEQQDKPMDCDWFIERNGSKKHLLFGFTLADSSGPKRLKKLEDSRLNLQCQILEMLDQIECIDHEIQQITSRECTSTTS